MTTRLVVMGVAVLGFSGAGQTHGQAARYRSVAAGTSFTCALDSAGTAYCWGANRDGRLGLGVRDTLAHPVPTAVAGATRFTYLSAGGTQFGLAHACGLAAAGAIYCWGSDYAGQVAGPQPPSPTILTPIAVAGGLAGTAVSAGGVHTCALTSGGTRCWGGDNSGQIGHAGYESRVPVAPMGDRRFSAIAAGEAHTCAIQARAGVLCWGSNDRGQMGRDPALVPRFIAVDTGVAVPGLFSGLAAGGAFTCALTPAGVASCWGANSFGQLGAGTADTAAHGVPVAVAGSHAFRALAAGRNHACGVTRAGAALCWGRNSYGMLGNGTTTDSPTPVPVSGELAFQQLSAGDYHTCGVTRQGELYCWGFNYFGQLGDGTTEQRLAPVRVAGQR